MMYWFVKYNKSVSVKGKETQQIIRQNGYVNRNSLLLKLVREQEHTRRYTKETTKGDAMAYETIS